MSSVVGVDIGFQNSVIAAAGRGGVDVILNGNSNRLNPYVKRRCAPDLWLLLLYVVPKLPSHMSLVLVCRLACCKIVLPIFLLASIRQNHGRL
jgi:Hsp70 protein